MGYNNTSEKSESYPFAENEEGFLEFSKLKKKEYIRLILQSLFELGYSAAAKLLEKESGFEYESKGVYELRESIYNGDWVSAETLVETLNLVPLSQRKSSIFMLKKQKYIELLESKKTKEALSVLRNEIALLGIEESELHELTSLMMCSPESLRKKTIPEEFSVENRRRSIYQQFQQFVPSSLVIPPHRLETLLQQAINKQISDCLYFTSPESEISLYQDFISSQNDFPRFTTRILDDHKDEVWFVSFSYDGKKLASASKDSSIIIWDSETWKILFTLSGHSESVSFLAWSSNNSMLLSCGNDRHAVLWNTKTGELIETFKKHQEPVTSCAWFSDNLRFVTGVSTIYFLNIDGTLLHRWTGLRVTDLAVTYDDSKLVAVCTEQRIRIFDLNDKTEVFLEEAHSITSLSLSLDSKYALVNIAASEIHLWDLESKKMLNVYKGQKQGTYVIRSCFGGPLQNFVVSGSEDFNVYVWHRDTKILLETLTGHSGTVNSVSWNPKNSTMFASASDDCTIRIWGKCQST